MADITQNDAYKQYAMNTVTVNGLPGISAGPLPYSAAAAGVPAASTTKVTTPVTDALIAGLSDLSQKSTNAFLQNALDKSSPDFAISISQGKTANPYTIQFPDDLPQYYMTFEICNYIRQKPTSDTLKTVIATIALPLPDGEGLNDSTSTQWNDSSLTHWGNALENGSTVTGMIRSMLGQKDPDVNNVSGAQAIYDMGGDSLIYVAETIARKVGSAELAGTAESLTGLAPNPALAMTFKQVDFRKFQFTWLLSARNQPETDTIKNIVAALKKAQLPSFTAGSSLIFEYPNIVIPTIQPDAAKKYMTDFKPCVITAVNVRYSPASKAPSFYAGSKAPVFVELSIALEEMQIRLPGDYETNVEGISNKANKDSQNAADKAMTSIDSFGGNGGSGGTNAGKTTKPSVNPKPTAVAVGQKPTNPYLGPDRGPLYTPPGPIMNPGGLSVGK